MLFLPSLTRETWLLAEFGRFLPQLYLIYSIRIRLTALLLARIDLAIFTFPYQRKRSRRGRLIYRQIWARELSIKISANFHNPTYQQCVQNIGNCKLNFLLCRPRWFINFWVVIIPDFRLFMPRRFRRWVERAIRSLAKNQGSDQWKLFPCNLGNN